MHLALPAAVLAVASLLTGGQQHSEDRCKDRSCYPITGNLLIGRKHRLKSSSTCGSRGRERFVSQMFFFLPFLLFCTSPSLSAHGGGEATPVLVLMVPLSLANRVIGCITLSSRTVTITFANQCHLQLSQKLALLACLFAMVIG
ncbi:unnamed protein product [Heligmosomoides polygyrus]|uniref:Secreted protein n=1 Tax=Heligmosomoides polygyrus TaxID=6339 RepID=A0A183FTQ1_HELPZ|nr:unnamed protein product [Heligmosomoides polygyrus]